MRLTLLLSAGLILAGCTADQSSLPNSDQRAKADGDCVATSADFERLQEDFRRTAIKVAKKTTHSRVTFDDGIRAPLERPFAEPPQVRFRIQQNPFRIDYGWSIQLAKGCRYDEAKPGFFLDSADLALHLNKNNEILDDKIHYKIKQK